MRQWISQHLVQWTTITSAAVWIFNNVVSIMISNLPAPTKDSSPKYVYWFKVLNTIIGNIARAKSTTLEQSPNWQAAVDKHIANLNGGQNGAIPNPGSDQHA